MPRARKRSFGYTIGFQKPQGQLGQEAFHGLVILVPKTGLEPVRGYPQRFLRPQRLPFRHSGVIGPIIPLSLALSLYA